MAHWVDPTPPRPNLAIGAGLLVIAALAAVGIAVWAGNTGGNPAWLAIFAACAAALGALTVAYVRS